jgi:DNA-binding SARP family transcriptional activator
MTVTLANSPLAAPVRRDHLGVNLFGGPYVICGEQRLVVPEGSKRLLAFVAIRGGRVDRRHAAGTLWPAGDDERAAGNLRSALWRLRGVGIDVIEADKCALRLRSGTATDLQDTCAWAERLIVGSASESDLRILRWEGDVGDLLPGWYDDWVIFERERLRQRVLHALEALSGRLVQAGRYAESIEAAMQAVQIEPLRESAQRALVEAHIAEGNFVEARRAFLAYRALAQQELGVQPGAALAALLQRARVPVDEPAARH